MKKKIAILASGTGSNAEQLVRYFSDHPEITVTHLITNNPKSGIFAIGQTYGIESVLFSNEDFVTGEQVLRYIKPQRIDLVVLAGFLRKIPELFLQAYPNRIVNIHPALLPDFGGKGMYGTHVHEAVRQSGVNQTGITIHLVDNQYDHGTQIAQYTCQVDPNDTVADIAHKVQLLEHSYYPSEVEKYLKNLS
jgi:phosphoribosylglycinamide formyltransferase 1